MGAQDPEQGQRNERGQPVIATLILCALVVFALLIALAVTIGEAIG